jgi:hypothetical protein
MGPVGVVINDCALGLARNADQDRRWLTGQWFNKPVKTQFIRKICALAKDANDLPDVVPAFGLVLDDDGQFTRAATKTRKAIKHKKTPAPCYRENVRFCTQGQECWRRLADLAPPQVLKLGDWFDPMFKVYHLIKRLSSRDDYVTGRWPGAGA